MVRTSMLTGWWQLIRRPSQLFGRRRGSLNSEEFVSVGSPRQLTLSRPLPSDTKTFPRRKSSAAGPVPVLPPIKTDRGKPYRHEDSIEMHERVSQDVKNEAEIFV